MFDIIRELENRGLVHQMTDGNLGAKLMEKPRVVYAGFDPTAESLHVGHLVQLMGLRRFQRAGHRPIAMIGGATGMIGDPSGKNEERNLLSLEVIEKNVEGIKKQMERFLSFDGQEGALLLNNYDWLSRFGYLEFLRDVGKLFTVNTMMAKESVKLRLAQADTGLSYTEFSYQILQSYDFYHLNKEHQCEIQIGGSDQWGNITSGVDLVRRLSGNQVYGLTSPLLTKSDGKKMGKTESGALWLDADRTSPYHFYQYWINLDDADVQKTLGYFTDLTSEEITAVMEEHVKQPEKRTAQRTLADEFTRLVHGGEGLDAARRATEIFFGGEIRGLNDKQLVSIFADVPNCEFPAVRLAEGLPLPEVFMESGLAKSKGEARRTITQGGAYINNRKVTETDYRLTASDLASETVILLRSGKKNYALLRFV
ncbi:MAG: tyrosine--tRNA ligase [Planctomycetaceae bacterium]|jgi:tyrosyl-tRNA synthetase|nr:tyrosine--tRNA ligase [Planctomycetaceae bacterium]